MSLRNWTTESSTTEEELDAGMVRLRWREF
jgi:hypothetical protein